MQPHDRYEITGTKTQICHSRTHIVQIFSKPSPSSMASERKFVKLSVTLLFVLTLRLSTLILKTEKTLNARWSLPPNHGHSSQSTLTTVLTARKFFCSSHIQSSLPAQTNKNPHRPMYKLTTRPVYKLTARPMCKLTPRPMYKLTARPLSFRECTVTCLATPLSGATLTMNGDPGMCVSLYLMCTPYMPGHKL